MARWLARSADLALPDLDSVAWEPRRSPSEPMQDPNLEFLLSWEAASDTRGGDRSLHSHQAVFNQYQVRRVELQRVPQLSLAAAEVSSWSR